MISRLEPSTARSRHRPSRNQAGRTAALLDLTVASLRRDLAIAGTLSDAAIHASLAEVSRFSDPLHRLQAAFDSTLGQWLALNADDYPAALQRMLTAVPSRAGAQLTSTAS